MTLQERFRRFVDLHGLFSPGDCILLGFSGGADSMCLLSLLVEEPVRVVAAHLDHRLRPESGEEAKRCRELATSVGVEFVCDGVDVRALAKHEGVGIEEAGRLARYAFFEKARQQVCAQLIATAHTLDDHVETMLLNLARGAGMRGLSGIPVRRDAIVRPLLFARKSETEAFCRERGFDFIQDPSNLDEAHARVRARQRVLPAFEHLHPGAVDNAARTAAILRDEDALLDSLARFELSVAREVRNHPLSRWISRHHARYERARLAALPVALRRRAVVLAVREMGGSPTFEIADALAAALANAERMGANVEQGVLAQVTGVALVVKNRRRVEPLEQRLGVPGVVSGEGWRIVAVGGSTPRRVGRRALVQAVRASLCDSLSVRFACRGDSIRIGSRERKLLPALKAEGIPVEARIRLPVVANALGVVWAPGLGVAERARSRSGEAVVSLRFEAL